MQSLTKGTHIYVYKTKPLKNEFKIHDCKFNTLLVLLVL